MNTPTPGDIYAVYVPEARRWCTYQYLRHTTPKAGKLGRTEFVPFEGWFDSPEGIAPDTLVPVIVHIPTPDAIYVRNVNGYIPPDHVLIAQRPPLTQNEATSYGGGTINTPFWTPEDMRVEQRETYSHEIYAKDQIWDLRAFAKANHRCAA